MGSSADSFIDYYTVVHGNGEIHSQSVTLQEVARDQKMGNGQKM